MTISWYGQSCFRLESKDVNLIIDPFSKEIGLRTPRLNGNIFVVTHEHYDHNNLDGVPEGAFIVRGPGEYEIKGVFIQGFSSYHDNAEGKERGMNTVFLINMEELRVCHLGDLGQVKLTEEQLDSIGDVDILMIPVGGKYTIDSQAAVEIISQIEPKIIIPMHYKVEGLKIDLDDPKKFVKAIGLKPEEVENLKINKKTLPQEEVKLVMFKP